MAHFGQIIKPDTITTLSGPCADRTSQGNTSAVTGRFVLTMQALAHYPDGHADGVDVSAYALERAAGAAAERGLADRLTLHEHNARTYVPDGDYDLVLCVGWTHAF